MPGNRRWMPIDEWLGAAGESWADIDRIRPSHVEQTAPENRDRRYNEDEEYGLRS
ncbi:hypothetical protein [Streptomyces chartreusis]|uniref:hypothetical protein n=1 Tax=Streptomyces chartreusis TaxID=1969 RepID=UPI0038296D30